MAAKIAKKVPFLGTLCESVSLIFTGRLFQMSGSQTEKSASTDTIRYVTRCYFRPKVRSKADMSQLNLILFEDMVMFSRHTHTHTHTHTRIQRQTHRPRNLGNNRPHLCTPCWRCGLIMKACAFLSRDETWNDDRHLWLIIHSVDSCSVHVCSADSRPALDEWKHSLPWLAICLDIFTARHYARVGQKSKLLI